MSSKKIEIKVKFKSFSQKKVEKIDSDIVEVNKSISKVEEWISSSPSEFIGESNDSFEASCSKVISLSSLKLDNQNIDSWFDSKSPHNLDFLGEEIEAKEELPFLERIKKLVNKIFISSKDERLSPEELKRRKQEEFKKLREYLLKEKRKLERTRRILLKCIHSGRGLLDLRNSFRKKINYIFKRLDSEHSLNFNY